jgi:hypothetical protein
MHYRPKHQRHSRVVGLRARGEFTTMASNATACSTSLRRDGLTVVSSIRCLSTPREIQFGDNARGLIQPGRASLPSHPPDRVNSESRVQRSDSLRLSATA